MLGELFGAGAEAYGSYLNYKSMQDFIDQQKELAKMNLAAQERENALQRASGRELLDVSRPQMSATDLGNLLFAQGQGAYNEQSNNMLQQAMRQNLRAGSPVSGADLTAKFADRSSAGMADRRSEATLKGITGTLPGAAAIQGAAGLYSNPTPQMSPWMSQPDFSLGNTIGSIGGSIGDLMNQFLNKKRPTATTVAGGQGWTGA